jgi:hypothetical protein
LRSSFWARDNQKMERYSLDTEKFSLELFNEQIRTKKMIPSRVLLKEGREKYFGALEKKGVKNLDQLMALLGNRDKIKLVSRECGIPELYLTLLKREAGSYLAKPFLLADFPGIPLEYTEVLKTRGIRNTRNFFESVQNTTQRTLMAKQTGIPDSRLREILALCDLSRITGVGGFYARIIYEAGLRSVCDFATTDAATHNKNYRKVLEKRGYPVKKLSEDDLQYCIDYATLLTQLNPNPAHL